MTYVPKNLKTGPEACCEMSLNPRTSSIQVAMEKFVQMTDKQIPDSFLLPSLGAGYVKTGDFLFIPCGHIAVEKTLNELCTSFRSRVGAVAVVIFGRFRIPGSRMFLARFLPRTHALICDEESANSFLTICKQQAVVGWAESL